jgi:iron-sulfur cluster assembly protein
LLHSGKSGTNPKETEHVATIERPEVEIERPEGDVVTLTERAAFKIKSLMAEEPEGEATVLRVAIQGGGCSGFEYALGFDQGPQAGDVEREWHGVTVVVDPFSAPYLAGSRIDFLETLQESGFKIENPNVASSCGCGHSFQVAEGEELPEDSVGGCGSGCSH